MRVLPSVRPTPEQLSIISYNQPGTEIIRGAAGSGKTTTALLRLRSLIGLFVSRRRRERRVEPIRILVLTYNRTLRGYIEALTQQQFGDSDEIDLEISTFARWGRNILGAPALVEDNHRKSLIIEYGSNINLPNDFLIDEVDYIMGRFLPSNYDRYIRARRFGRGNSPRVDQTIRNAILNDIIAPYQLWKESRGVLDWNNIAVNLTELRVESPYDIIIADEVQDFSANQIRAITNQLALVHSLTLIVDTAQRIYARGFTWQEAGIVVRPENSRRLTVNYRNTVEIAKFAAPVIAGLPLDDDATIPDFNACQAHGPLPIVLTGSYSKQTRFVIDYISNQVDLGLESVAILHPLGGGWFDHLRETLTRARLPYVELTREMEWPQGNENIALITLHSSKGLEFDHVVIIGLNAEVTYHYGGEDDDRLSMLRKLLAMGISRAKKSVIIGYKPDEASTLINYLEEGTYERRNL